MDVVLRWLNHKIVDPYVLGVEPPAWPEVDLHEQPYDPHYSYWRNFLVLWTFYYIGSLVIYFLTASTTYFLFFRPTLKDTPNPDGTVNPAWWKPAPGQIKAEIWVSTWSLFFMSGMTVPCELAVVYGYSKVYYNVEDYGMAYLILSPVLFIFVTDMMIYFIHRMLHWGPIYAIHKLHHKWKHTTPYSAFHFHPLDGWLQGLPYHIFVFLFPFHNWMYAISVGIVAMWTINIHDRVTLYLPGVNGAAHHTIHHTKFNYNYGQYFILWDWLCGTFKSPYKYPQYNLAFHEKYKKEQSKLESQGKHGADAIPKMADRDIFADEYEPEEGSPKGGRAKAE